MTKLRPLEDAPGRPGGSAVLVKLRLRLYSPRLIAPRPAEDTSSAGSDRTARLASGPRACKHCRMADADSPSRPDARQPASSASSRPSARDEADADDDAWPEGLVAVGGALDPETLVRAYRAGIFPWSSDPAVTWWSPDPRAIFDLDTFRPHRSVGKTARRCGWRFAVDRDFVGVMRRCAEATAERPATWITDDFVSS